MYKQQVQTLVSDPENLPRVGNLKTGIETVYEFRISLFFPALENEGWYRTGNDGEKQAKTRYKRIDYDNRIKFVQDCLSGSLGIDDSQIFRGLQEKREDPLNPRAEVEISVADIDDFIIRRPR